MALMPRPVVDGERFVVGESAASAVASAQVFWVRGAVADNDKDRDMYAELRARDRLWVHMDVDSAREAIGDELAAHVTGDREWKPKVWRVRVLVEEVKGRVPRPVPVPWWRRWLRRAR